MTTFKELDDQFKTMKFNRRIEVLRDLIHCDDKSAPIVRFARKRMLTAAYALRLESDYAVFWDYYFTSCPEDFQYNPDERTLEGDWSLALYSAEELRLTYELLCDADNSYQRYHVTLDLFRFEKILAQRLDDLSNALQVDLSTLGAALQAFRSGADLFSLRDYLTSSEYCIEELEAELDLQRLIDLDAFEVLWRARNSARGVA